VGAGIFGFLINMPVVSYFEAGTLSTLNHGSTAEPYLGPPADRIPSDPVFLKF